MTGRHRPPRRSRAAIAVLASVLVVAVLAGGWGTWAYLRETGCTPYSPSLTVAAAPEIAPVVRSVGQRWASSRAGGCVRLEVTPADPATIATAVAVQRTATLTGLGQPNGTAHLPEVWIPDSSSWLSRLRQVSNDLVPSSAPALAVSPVVLATAEPVARGLGWPGQPLTWDKLLRQMTTGTALRTGIVDPARDAASLSGLLALGTAAVGDPSGTTAGGSHGAAAAGDPAGAAAQQTMVAVLRTLASGKSTVRADLLSRFPGSADPATLASSLSVAPLTEQAVITYNAAEPPVKLVSLYLDPAPTPMDYPYVVLPAVGQGADLAGHAQVANLAGELLSALSGPDFRSGLASAGLREPDGSYTAGFPAGPFAPTGPLTASPQPGSLAIEQALSTWIAVTKAARMLAVIDVSGSMLNPVPTASGSTREQVTIRAAEAGLSMFDDDWAVGLWIFSTDLSGTKPYRQLVPIGPLATQRATLAGALQTVKPKPDGDTGLYDTVLAAYKTVQADWDPGKVNSVVVMTDGRNENPGGLTLSQLTARLADIVDPKRPIQMVMLGIGTDVSQPELTRIADAAGGGSVFVATDPSQIGQIFLQAIAQRPRGT